MFSTQIELSKLDYQAELLTKSELKALQAQINPYFLFNTINTVASLTRSSPNKARELLLHLSNYFRNSLNDPSDEIDIYKEIEALKSYLEIEKARFGEKLKIVFNIPEGINCKLPPLIIQPIVENAVKHGIFEKAEGGEIILDVKNDILETIIIISDNGTGMSKSKLEKILIEDNKNCIGLRNVNERLKAKYGQEYELKIRSEENVGTTVLIRIPHESKVIYND